MKKPKIFFEVTPELFTKLKIHLAEKGITMREWGESQIRKIPEKKSAEKKKETPTPW